MIAARGILSGLVVILLGFSNPASATPAAKPARYALANEPPTLDWNRATDNVSYRILNDLMEGLMQFNERLEPIAALAKEMKVKDGGKTYIFYLDPKAKWSDGEPLVAQHFVDSWIRLLHPKTAAEYAYFLYDIVGAQDFNAGRIKEASKVGVSAPNPHEFHVRLREPRSYFPAITTFMVTFPIRLDLISRYGEERWTEARHMVTLGPYLLKTWRHEYKITLEKNPLFYGKPMPQVPKIEIFFINDPTVALTLYETKGLDFVELPPLAIPHYRDNPDYRFGPKLRGYYFGFNVKKKPFDHVLVRRAFGHAIDRAEIPQILKGAEEPTTSWIPQGMFGHNPNIGLAFDPIKARRLLSEAGYDQGRNFPQVTLAYNTDMTNKLMAEFFQAQIKKNLNIDLLIDNQEWKVYLKNIAADAPHLFRMGWGADYPDPDNFMVLFTQTSGNNHTRWKNPAYDTIIASAAREGSLPRRKLYYDAAQSILCEQDVAILPMFNATINSLSSSRFENLYLNPMGYIAWKNVRPKP